MLSPKIPFNINAKNNLTSNFSNWKETDLIAMNIRGNFLTPAAKNQYEIVTNATGTYDIAYDETNNSTYNIYPFTSGELHPNTKNANLYANPALFFKSRVASRITPTGNYNNAPMFEYGNPYNNTGNLGFIIKDVNNNMQNVDTINYVKMRQVRDASEPYSGIPIAEFKEQDAINISNDLSAGRPLILDVFDKNLCIRVPIFADTCLDGRPIIFVRSEDLMVLPRLSKHFIYTNFLKAKGYEVEAKPESISEELKDAIIVAMPTRNFAGNDRMLSEEEFTTIYNKNLIAIADKTDAQYAKINKYLPSKYDNAIIDKKVILGDYKPGSKYSEEEGGEWMEKYMEENYNELQSLIDTKEQERQDFEQASSEVKSMLIERYNLLSTEQIAEEYANYQRFFSASIANSVNLSFLKMHYLIASNELKLPVNRYELASPTFNPTSRLETYEEYLKTASQKRELNDFEKSFLDMVQSESYQEFKRDVNLLMNGVSDIDQETSTQVGGVQTEKSLNTQNASNLDANKRKSFEDNAIPSNSTGEKKQKVENEPNGNTQYILIGVLIATAAALVSLIAYKQFRRRRNLQGESLANLRRNTQGERFNDNIIELRLLDSVYEELKKQTQSLTMELNRVKEESLKTATPSTQNSEVDIKALQDELEYLQSIEAYVSRLNDIYTNVTRNLHVAENLKLHIKSAVLTEKMNEIKKSQLEHIYEIYLHLQNVGNALDKENYTEISEAEKREVENLIAKTAFNKRVLEIFSNSIEPNVKGLPLSSKKQAHLYNLLSAESMENLERCILNLKDFTEVEISSSKKINTSCYAKPNDAAAKPLMHGDGFDALDLNNQCRVEIHQFDQATSKASWSLPRFFGSNSSKSAKDVSAKYTSASIKDR